MLEIFYRVTSACRADLLLYIYQLIEVETETETQSCAIVYNCDDKYYSLVISSLQSSISCPYSMIDTTHERKIMIIDHNALRKSNIFNLQRFSCLVHDADSNKQWVTCFQQRNMMLGMIKRSVSSGFEKREWTCDGMYLQ